MVTVAVLGCGPGGMSFCHAVEQLRQQSSKENDNHNVVDSLVVTCFEKSSTPGGVWKAANPASSEGEHKEIVNMYAALWTNGPSHGTEYFDYTYDDHFHRPVNVYMQRQEVLGYMLGRVTRNCPDFFQKYVQFDTAVTRVVYNHETSQFDITLECQKTHQITTRHFDKCVWACGENSRQHVPEAFPRLLHQGGFKGRIIHSADTENLKEDVQGKRILLIGGGYSAEDLALQAIKLGVEKVYISSRWSGAYVSDEVYPMDKVELLTYQKLSSVTENGNCLNFEYVKWSWPDIYTPSSSETATQLRDIDTVIFCTGYKVNLDMLDDELNKGYPKWGLKSKLEIPDSWEMPKNKYFSTQTGEDVAPGQVMYNAAYCHPELYRGVLISNPNMMFISIYGSYFPLLAVDTSAWMLVGFLTGRIGLPSADEMRKKNAEQALCEMKIPYLRYYMDSNYCHVVNDTWDNEESPGQWSKASQEYSDYTIKLLARDMQEAGYPFSLGTYYELNENGQALSTFNELSSAHRSRLTKEYIAEHPTTTFRDYDDADQFYSLFTGTKAVPLPKEWLKINPEGADAAFGFADEIKLE